MFGPEFWLIFGGAFALEFVQLNAFDGYVKNRSGYLSQYRNTLKPIPLGLRICLYGLVAFLIANDGTIAQILIAAVSAIVSSHFIFFWHNGGYAPRRGAEESD